MGLDDLPDNLSQREINDIAHRTKQILIALNSIAGMNTILQSNVGIAYTQLDTTEERLTNLLTSYSYALGFKNVNDGATESVNIQNIEEDIRSLNNVFDYNIFDLAQTEYDRGQSEASR